MDGRGTSSEMASASSGKPAPIGASRDGASRDGASNDGVADRASADPAGEPASDAASAGPRRTLRGRATRTMVDEEGAGAASSSGETSSEGATRVAASRSPSGASPEVTTAAATATRKPAPGEPGSGEAPPEFGDDAFERTFGGPAERPRRPDIYIPPPPGEPALPQTLSQAQVLQVVVANKAKVQRCVDEHRAQSQETGRLVMRFSIATSGKVQEVEPVSPSHLRDSDLARCLEAQIGDWSFPRHQQVGEPVVMPFAF